MKTNFLFFFFSLLFFFPSLAQQVPSSTLKDLIASSKKLNLSQAQLAKLRALQQEIVQKKEEATPSDIEHYRDQQIKSILGEEYDARLQQLEEFKVEREREREVRRQKRRELKEKEAKQTVIFLEIAQEYYTENMVLPDLDKRRKLESQLTLADQNLILEWRAQYAQMINEDIEKAKKKLAEELNEFTYKNLIDLIEIAQYPAHSVLSSAILHSFKKKYPENEVAIKGLLERYNILEEYIEEEKYVQFQKFLNEKAYQIFEEEDMASRIGMQFLTNWPLAFVLLDPDSEAIEYLQGNGLKESNQHQIRLFPTPASEQQTIQLNLDSAGTVEVELLNIGGQSLSPVLSQQLGSGEQQIKVDISQLPTAVFFYRITDQAGQQSVIKSLKLK